MEFKVTDQLIKHPTKDIGAENFLADRKKIKRNNA
jgi:hypothetical protein